MSDDIFDLAKEIAQKAVRDAARETVSSFIGGTPIDVVEKQVSRIVEQDPLRTSWRVWGAFWSGAAAILTLPEVQAGLQAAIGSVVPVAWAPVVPAAMGAVWAIVSKAKDKRPVRGK